ncbi:MAG: polysaccharide biosynthesis protein [Lachnospiraceae bacterium]|nr:polysaccharide biosynthesis protein [Lachnospiraceae bacterium]
MLLKSKGYGIKLATLVLVDIFVINFSSLLALLVRFDFMYSAISEKYITYAAYYAPVNTLIILLVMILCKLYKSIWSYASIHEVFFIMEATVISAAIQVVMMWGVFKYRMPIGYHIFYFICLGAGLTIPRFGYRLLRMMKRTKAEKTERVMIVGAGQAGMTLANELKISAHLDKKLVCFVDDNVSKKGRYLVGVEIAGTRHDIPKLVAKKQIDSIYIAIPSASRKTLKEIISICNETGKEVKTLPGLYQLVNEEVAVSQLRDVQIEDLLGREPVKTDMTEISKNITGKTVLVTGGGGSIGSELCRQIASYAPKRLIILDIYENNAYEIQQELTRKYGGSLDLVTLIGSVRNTNRVNTIFEKYKPEVVFHAAAHKHVPLMEESPNEAIKNNVFGTFKTAAAAGRYGVEKFVLISTDKAVNPTNIMGASKRLCEMIVQYFNTIYDTEFVAVRFGNVLGSNGSVIPLFKKQIAEGGPVTVTHPEITRFFMTIPEAVSLVLQAETYAKGGEIFVLDMGEPVKIDMLARNLIRLSGYEPDVDIKVVYTGLRPGEKLYEEILMDEEGLQDTANHMIHIGKPIEMNYEEFIKELQKLKEACEKDVEDEEIKKYVSIMVPTYVQNSFS